MKERRSLIQENISIPRRVGGEGDREPRPRGRLTRHYQAEGNELEGKTNKEERETRGDGEQEGGSRESRRNGRRKLKSCEIRLPSELFSGGEATLAGEDELKVFPVDNVWPVAEAKTSTAANSVASTNECKRGGV
ncbi:hypothetical protein K0M31_012995 [Melipona bicolor]|uniref:Uncharacterized protein n=1 Tax=Melipona bicolor TaxID=60889 RepID=A0AA40KH01_9HYME|nr:hypothetical protein K0M31_012995 [Melipona bicolor]